MWLDILFTASLPAVYVQYKNAELPHLNCTSMQGQCTTI
uniref:Uncharacterized protein n=1 Tax=Anguilla anguilla TaxID=7936 RepID=A0A0E9UZ57_ANGAN